MTQCLLLNDLRGVCTHIKKLPGVDKVAIIIILLLYYVKSLTNVVDSYIQSCPVVYLCVNRDDKLIIIIILCEITNKCCDSYIQSCPVVYLCMCVYVVCVGGGGEG